MQSEPNTQSDTETHVVGAEDNQVIVFIKELSERDRSYMVNHFLSLDANDRILRFGTALTDEALTRYVENIDFTRDTMFGVYESTFNLVGVGHLAFPPAELLPAMSDGGNKKIVAEFGVSVLAPARRLFVGTKLFDRAALHCRNKNVETLYIHCLASNKPMLCIAKKAGMEIHREQGEVDGYLKLPLADPDSIMYEAVEEQVATLDYALEGKFRSFVDWMRRQLLSPPKEN